MENWKQAPDWPEYEVSNMGRIRRSAPAATKMARAEIGRIRKPVCISGYQAVTLTRPGHRKTVLIHRLVARAFLGESERGMEVNHKDSNRWNPKLDNLEWVTRSGNRQHGYDHGHCEAKGSKNGHSKLTEARVSAIRKADKHMFSTLADAYGVSVATIRDVAARRTWKHVS